MAPEITRYSLKNDHHGDFLDNYAKQEGEDCTWYTLRSQEGVVACGVFPKGMGPQMLIDTLMQTGTPFEIYSAQQMIGIGAMQMRIPSGLVELLNSAPHIHAYMASLPERGSFEPHVLNFSASAPSGLYERRRSYLPVVEKAPLENAKVATSGQQP